MLLIFYKEISLTILCLPFIAKKYLSNRLNENEGAKHKSKKNRSKYYTYCKKKKKAEPAEPREKFEFSLLTHEINVLTNWTILAVIRLEWFEHSPKLSWAAGSTY